MTIQDHGFGEFQVPEMPAYVGTYSKRGNAFSSETTPVMHQARFGNRSVRGRMDAYLPLAEDSGYTDVLRIKRGNTGAEEQLRWSGGYDWRGNFGIASLAANKNYEMSTRGGQLRKGGPKRADYIDRPGFWFEQVRPGISHSRLTQNNDNYSGVYENKRRTPVIELENDMLVLREMIENNPFAIHSHAATQAKAVYDAELGANTGDSATAAYRSDFFK